MRVTVRFPDGDEESFLLGSREVAADGVEAYSEKSPLGAAINGKRIGETTSYELPNGTSLSVAILDAKPYVP